MFPESFGLRVANLRFFLRGALGLGLEPFWSRASYKKVRATAKRGVLRLSLRDIAVAPRPTATGSFVWSMLEGGGSPYALMSFEPYLAVRLSDLGALQYNPLPKPLRGSKT